MSMLGLLGASTMGSRRDRTSLSSRSLRLSTGVAKDLPPEGVHGSDKGPAGRPRSLPQFCCRLRVVSKGAERRRFDRPIVEQVPETGREGAGLARTCRSDDASRTEPWLAAAAWSGASPPSIGAWALAGSSRPRVTVSACTIASIVSIGPRGPPSIHAGVPSARKTSAEPPSVAPIAGRLDRPPPLGCPAPCVIAVRPYEEVEPLEREDEGGTDLIGFSVLDLGRSERRRVDAEFDDDRFAGDPGVMESLRSLLPDR